MTFAQHHSADTPEIRKARGAFFTPPELVDYIADWAIRSSDDSVFEPSAGDAEFLVAAVRRLQKLGASGAPSVHGVEIHDHSAEVGRNRVRNTGGNPQIHTSDFFAVDPAPVHTAVIGNPPYVLDASDYEQAFRNFSQCFTGRGHTVSDPVLNPADNLTYIYTLDTVGLDPSVVTQDQNECSADFLEVEAMYTATTPQVMDEPLRLAIIECMQAQDLPIDPDAKNYPDFITLAGDSADTEWRISFGSCLSQAGAQLYPDLESIPVGF